MTERSGSTTSGVTATVLALAIVSMVLVAIAIPNINSTIQRGRQKRTMSAMRLLATGLGSFHVDHGGYPYDGEGIEAAWRRLSPRYIVDPPLRDGWGRPFVYQAPALPGTTVADEYVILSLGADGRYQGLTGEGSARYFDCDIIYMGGP